MGTYEEIQEARFGRDGVLPGLGDTVRPTASGDWPTIAGRPNLLAAQVRRAVTAQGEMVHRPLYGGDLPKYVETLSDPATLARMELSVRLNALRDPRIEEATTTAEISGPRTLVQLEVHPRGEDTTETATLVQE